MKPAEQLKHLATFLESFSVFLSVIENMLATPTPCSPRLHFKQACANLMLDLGARNFFFLFAVVVVVARHALVMLSLLVAKGTNVS
jgi:hypothetical protein